MIARCLFEQSGTFKNEFKKLGIKAYDYDIKNDFNETDFIVDLFEEITRGGGRGDSSIFDDFTTDDIILAFFPCVRFEDQITLAMRGESFSQRKWRDDEKLIYSMRLNHELCEMYRLISELALIAIRKDFKLIIENPKGTMHYLTRYWPLKPKLIDGDRRQRGDYYKKPTQYWFINCEPKFRFIVEPQEFIQESFTVDKGLSIGRGRAVERSMIHSNYAKRFIREFII